MAESKPELEQPFFLDDRKTDVTTYLYLSDITEREVEGIGVCKIQIFCTVTAHPQFIFLFGAHLFDEAGTVIKPIGINATDRLDIAYRAVCLLETASFIAARYITHTVEILSSEELEDSLHAQIRLELMRILGRPVFEELIKVVPKNKGSIIEYLNSLGIEYQDNF